MCAARLIDKSLWDGGADGRGESLSPRVRTWRQIRAKMPGAPPKPPPAGPPRPVDRGVSGLRARLISSKRLPIIPIVRRTLLSIRAGENRRLAAAVIRQTIQPG